MNKVIRYFLIIVLLLTTHVAAIATSLRQQADSAYRIGHYAEAERLYTALTDSIEDEEAYYNLGNAEFQLRRYPQSILAFKRALRIAPDHEDAAFNLLVAQKYTKDKFGDSEEMFFITFIRSWVTTHSTHYWISLSFGFLLLLFVCMGIYLLTDKIWQRKLGFISMLIAGIMFLTTTGLGMYQKYKFYNNKEAVIIADEIVLYSSPSESSNELRSIHSGTIINITDTKPKGWLQIKLPNGEECWMKDGGYERVLR